MTRGPDRVASSSETTGGKGRGSTRSRIGVNRGGAASSGLGSTTEAGAAFAPEGVERSQSRMSFSARRRRPPEESGGLFMGFPGFGGSVAAAGPAHFDVRLVYPPRQIAQRHRKGGIGRPMPLHVGGQGPKDDGTEAAPRCRGKHRPR